MDFEGLAFAALFVFWILRALGVGRGRRQSPEEEAERRRRLEELRARMDRSRLERERRERERARAQEGPRETPTVWPEAAASTQEEARLLEYLFGGLAGGPVEAPRRSEPVARRRPEPAPEPEPEGEEVVEETESLEEVPEIVSLEEEVRRPPRALVDQDDAAEETARRRVAAAAARDRAHRVADHVAFDQRIRQEPADHTMARPALTAQQLRDAMVWREVLGPPKALRSEGEDGPLA